MVKRGQGPEGPRLEGISLEMDSRTFTGIRLSISWSIPEANTTEGDVIGKCCPQVTGAPIIQTLWAPGTSGSLRLVCRSIAVLRSDGGHWSMPGMGMAKTVRSEPLTKLERQHSGWGKDISHSLRKHLLLNI